MRARILLAAAVLAGAANVEAAAPPAKPVAPASRDWTRTVVATPEGGFRMGNPAAPIKLVEYGSLTCSHCAEFNAAAKDRIATQVRSGKLSFEFRTFVLNGVDVAATLLAHCAGPERFFPLTDTLYRAQGQWLGRAAGLTDAQKAQIEATPEQQRVGRIADLIGLTQLAAGHGVTPARGKQCLADTAALKRIENILHGGAGLGVQGTPTFLINGRKVAAADWKSLEPLLKAGG
jgi:protein-disulfide isomerase